MVEEAILDTKEFFDQCSPALQKELIEQKEVFELAISAIRAAPKHLDREAWSSEWVETMPILGAGNVERHCKKCGYLAEDTYSFCPQCGRPMTPEAWSELEKRLRG